MSKAPQVLSMNEEEILSYAERGYLQPNQVVKIRATGKKYRILKNNKMPTSFKELNSMNKNRFILQEVK